MSIVKRFITESIKKTEIDEFLQKKLERAGYGGVDLSKTPLGTHVVIYAMRPGIVIGRGGETIKDLATTLEENFKLANPQISVSEIEVPEFNAYVIASRVASALQRGVHFRRAGFWALNQVMEAGALGAEIVISGKLRTERARFEKFRAGYFPRCGDPALTYMKKAEAHVQLKPGIIGVRVKIMPPDAQFPDKIRIIQELPPEEIAEKPEKPEKPAETREQKVKVEEIPEEPPKPNESFEEKSETEEAVMEEAHVEESAAKETVATSAKLSKGVVEEMAGKIVEEAQSEKVEKPVEKEESKK
ncbi:30S ribosomal protein S3 [Candidatus Bathyarchaeota archaeon]|jgi:small subunit ribosomal protein S3|nr:30S ribosomal protein S3 [Candidatus Bathyarchaeota archaeon]